MAKVVCSIDECELHVKSRGMCGRHYRKDYYEKNREQLLAKQKLAREAADPEKTREYFKQHYLKNRERNLAQTKAWYQENRETNLAYQARWRTENAERLLEERRKLRADNPEAFREAGRAWRKANPDRKRVHDATYVAANREKLRERHREYYVEHSEEIKCRVQAWTRLNRDKRKKIALDYWSRKRSAIGRGVPFTLTQLNQRIAYYGDRCWICHAPWEHVDHVKPLKKGGPHMLANLRPACGSCNQSKNAIWPLSEVVLRLHSRFQLRSTLGASKETQPRSDPPTP